MSFEDAVYKCGRRTAYSEAYDDVTWIVHAKVEPRISHQESPQNKRNGSQFVSTDKDYEYCNSRDVGSMT